MAIVVGFDATVAVPVEGPFAHGEGTVVERDETDAAFEQAAGQEAVLTEGGEKGILVVETVEPAGGGGFLGEISDLGRALLHASRELI